MKRILSLVMLAALLGACDDPFLERYPLDEVSPQTYFKSEQDLSAYVDGLYGYLPGANIYGDDSQSDNVEQKNFNRVVAGQHQVETSAGAAGWSWDYLRRVNLFLENYDRAEIPDEVKDHYAGVARFFRAWFYFDKVKRFGDVPWYSGTLGPDDPDLYKARDSRTLVMDSVMADLDLAVAGIRENAPYGAINRWAALALKARVALHEGTFRKYHGMEGSQRFLEEAAEAAGEIMASGRFDLYTTGNPEEDYRNLFLLDQADAGEVILARAYDTGLEVRHTANGTFITGTLGAPGLTKSLVDTYLMADGTPFTSVPGHDTLSFYSEMQNRDPRLAQTIRDPGYQRPGSPDELVANFDNARTGYQITKFVMGPEFDSYQTNVNDLPIFRYAEILLIYAEAKAELGQLTQADLDATVNLLRDRVGMPHVQLGALVVDPVLEARYPNVTGAQKAAILEIRRERRVELAIEGFRYQDLMRWKAGPLLAETFKGIYFPRTGEHDLDRNGTIDVALVDVEPAERKPGVQYLVLGTVFDLSEGDRGNVIVHADVSKVFDEARHYYFPLPRTELVLNENLVQNPGWN